MLLILLFPQKRINNIIALWHSTSEARVRIHCYMCSCRQCLVSQFVIKRVLHTVAHLHLFCLIL